MADHAVSDHPAVQAQLDRLMALSPGRDVMGLERISELVRRLGNPHLEMPPVFHVAGTNGKGSTCAYLRAALEADGKSVHVFTSPHLVRFNERIRLAGTLIDDDTLARALEQVLDIGGDLNASFFEITTAAAFMLFATVPADACVIEVGLGGRLDATNVIHAPVACGIASLAIDHESFLLAPDHDVPEDPLSRIAFEKAGIAKAGAPLVTQHYRPAMNATIARVADKAGAAHLPRGRSWDIAEYQGQLHYRDEAGRIELPMPRLHGAHQISNMGLAIAMLRHQQAVPLPEAALRAAPLWAHWPARMQRLEGGPLNAMLPGRTLMLDGGHNPDAGKALADALTESHLADEGIDLIIGMLSNKDVAGFLKPLRPLIRSIRSLPVPGHEHHGPEVFAQVARAWEVPHRSFTTIQEALTDVAAGPRRTVLMAGTLYLAGQVLIANNQPPV
ncbi:MULTISPECIES: bifunctional folylpolyglutamate synthase/dihydrofolate synthase [unclassified Sphingobium]|uniref:bifunctional folylpolyglutamate synthase/dihydrofolate synthase n=1 Tax=unclassified Sphingobium TaxID=2611147 RepID=UPI0022241CEB|nr:MULTISPECIES: folylpolyglutamate synthase/dihydrofolate synthase family protein [unclassified Sphingobium]MCW2412869.1 dihydrofolate synthase/folylpolyglutamate synthase [Sphingobium sp. B8D3D]MCW2414833.1 dihydrofolate synthase/folylpolyglutamate synthase [Sphingobium sp. B8D3A]